MDFKCYIIHIVIKRVIHVNGLGVVFIYLFIYSAQIKKNIQLSDVVKENEKISANVSGYKF